METHVTAYRVIDTVRGRDEPVSRLLMRQAPALLTETSAPQLALAGTQDPRHLTYR